jgi:hypothetical protein
MAVNVASSLTQCIATTNQNPLASTPLIINLAVCSGVVRSNWSLNCC